MMVGRGDGWVNDVYISPLCAHNHNSEYLQTFQYSSLRWSYRQITARILPILIWTDWLLRMSRYCEYGDDEVMTISILHYVWLRHHEVWSVCSRTYMDHGHQSSVSLFWQIGPAFQHISDDGWNRFYLVGFKNVWNMRSLAQISKYKISQTGLWRIGCWAQAAWQQALVVAQLYWEEK